MNPELFDALDKVDATITSLDGEDFVIFDSWNQVYQFNYLLVEQLYPELLTLYFEPAGMIKEGRYKEIEFTRDMPEEIVEKLAAVGIKYGMIENYGFSDEYSLCDNCNKAIRTSPEYYGWKPNYLDFIYYDLCKECVETSDKEKYVEMRFNNPEHAINTTLISKADLEQLGFELVHNDYENGLHEGQNDNPKKILAEVQKQDPCSDYVFLIDDIGQFDVSFSLWKRKKEE